jgi:hypothetical protein
VARVPVDQHTAEVEDDGLGARLGSGIVGQGAQSSTPHDARR